MVVYYHEVVYHSEKKWFTTCLSCKAINLAEFIYTSIDIWVCQVFFCLILRAEFVITSFSEWLNFKHPSDTSYCVISPVNTSVTGHHMPLILFFSLMILNGSCWSPVFSGCVVVFCDSSLKLVFLFWLFQESERLRLFLSAVERHNRLMDEATNLQGELCVSLEDTVSADSSGACWLTFSVQWFERILKSLVVIATRAQNIMEGRVSVWRKRKVCAVLYHNRSRENMLC